MAAQLMRMKGPPLWGLLVVDGPGDHLLPGARFSGDQNRRLGGGYLRHQVQELRHGCAAADEVSTVEAGAQAFPEHPVLLLQVRVLQGPLQGKPQLVEVEGFCQVVVGPLLEGLDGRLHGGVGRHEDDGQGRVEPADFLQGLEPGDADHPDVHEDEIEGVAPHELDGRGAVVGLADLIAPAGDERLEHGSVGVVVINNENGVFRIHVRYPAFSCSVRDVFPFDGQENREGRSFSRLALQADLAAMGLDDPVHDGKAQSCPGGLCREVRIKDPPDIFLADARTGVGNGNTQAALVLARRHPLTGHPPCRWRQAHSGRG